MNEFQKKRGSFTKVSQELIDTYFDEVCDEEDPEKFKALEKRKECRKVSCKLMKTTLTFCYYFKIVMQSNSAITN